MNGIIQWIHPEKGFGFIQRGDGSKVFFRSSDVQLSSGAVPGKGDEVEFEIEDFRLVPRARGVRLIDRHGKAA